MSSIELGRQLVAEIQSNYHSKVVPWYKSTVVPAFERLADRTTRLAKSAAEIELSKAQRQMLLAAAVGSLSVILFTSIRRNKQDKVRITSD